MNFFFVSLFLFSFFFFFGASQEVSKKEGDSCVTTRHETGTCMKLDDCAVIVNIVKYEPISSEFRDYLINSACHKEEAKHTIMLCCPSKFTTFQATTEKPPSEELLQHRNIRLLPFDTCGEPLYTLRLNKDPQKNVHYYEYPWLVIITRYNTQKPTEKSNCPGALINRNYVLAHKECAYARNPILYVQLGEYLFENGIPKYCLEDVNREMICAPKGIRFYIENIIKDSNSQLALLRLERPAYEATPICLPVSSELLEKDYTGAIFIGVGTREIEEKFYWSTRVYKEHQNDEICVEEYLCTSQVDRGDIIPSLLMSSEFFKGKSKYFLVGIYLGYYRDQTSRPYFYSIAKYDDIKWILDNIRE